MKDGKFETQKEIFEALLRGEKITYVRWASNYVHLDSSGSLVTNKGVAYVGLLKHPEEFLIYQEPKPKKKIEVKFFRYHCHAINTTYYYISDWTNYPIETFKSPSKEILKIEERIEIYEIEG